MAANPCPSGSVCALSRREFLGSCATCAAGLSLLSLQGLEAYAQEAGPMLPGAKARVRLVFTHVPKDQATWPNIGYDYDGRQRDLIGKLNQGCPNIEFLPVTAQSAEEAKKVLEDDKDVDGYLVYMTGIWTGGPQVIAASGRPTLLVDDLYAGSGEFLTAFSAARRNKWKVAGVSSTDFKDVLEAARTFECLKRLQASTMLQVGGGWGGPEGIQKAFGTTVTPIPFEAINEAYSKADPSEAKKWADRWIKGADKVVEPSRAEIQKSGAMYLALLDVMGQHKAQAITMNCLGGFYGGKITAYPCLGFFQLNNDGFVGGCEGDLKSAMTMLVVGYLTGRPGYISDPVIDTSKNQIIYTHCVSTNKVYGPSGRANPYHIRSHSEDRKGAVVRSLMPLGEMTTTLEIDADKQQILFHQARTVANIDEDKACRTKLAAEVKGDINKLFNFWDTWGWHRVTFYGDLKRPVQHLAGLTGFEVIEEA